MSTNKSNALMNQLVSARVEVLEGYMKSHFSVFERVAAFETVEELQNAIAIMEKVKVMIEYPGSSLAKDRDLKKHLWDQMQNTPSASLRTVRPCPIFLSTVPAGECHSLPLLSTHLDTNQKETLRRRPAVISRLRMKPRIKTRTSHLMEISAY